MNNAKTTILELIAQSQEGRRLHDDIWGTFLKESVDNNSQGDICDADQLRDDLEYTINQFTRALRAIEPVADIVKLLKDAPAPKGPFTTVDLNTLIDE